MPSHPLTNFEIQKYYQNKTRFNGVFSNVGTHQIALSCRKSEIVYFDSFGVEHVSEEIKEFIGNKNIKANIFRVKSNNSIVCRYFYTGFIDFMFAGKTLVDFTSLFSPYDLKKMTV